MKLIALRDRWRPILLHIMNGVLPNGSDRDPAYYEDMATRYTASSPLHMSQPSVPINQWKSFVTTFTFSHYHPPSLLACLVTFNARKT